MIWWEKHERIHVDALAANLPDDNQPLDQNGSGAKAYAGAVSLYLALGVSKLADYSSVLVIWSPTRDQLKTTFSRQALPMTWDFAETNLFAGAAGDLAVTLLGMNRTVAELGAMKNTYAVQLDAQTQVVSLNRYVSTDPPYYDNIGYADLSDFFYVWLRRSLRDEFPQLLATIAVPKNEELIAAPYRHETRTGAETFFLDGMTLVMRNLANSSHQSAPLTIYYAFKQSETETEGTNSTGWELFK